ncbi:MAG: beta-propeller domain-containing protein [Oscillospiraceae bacterium]|jgi:uncharacterized secreted protein with C-terminal beta-propeller domain|nr:beta-propeller domain-containing protein [Oscillospiraceae bacterium]
MRSRTLWITRAVALALSVGVLAGLQFQIIPKIIPITQAALRPHDTITLDGRLAPYYREAAQAPRTVRAVQAASRPELPRVGDMVELLRLFNNMGVLMKQETAQPSEDGLWKGGVRFYAGIEAADTADMAASPAAGPMPSAPPVGGDVLAKSAADEGTAGASAGYSTTNSQVQGVEEGDIVKTDGDFLYVARGTQIHIVRADGGAMRHVSQIRPEGAYEGAYIREMYIAGDRLVLAADRWEPEVESEPASGGGGSRGRSAVDIWRPGKSFVGHLVYDISDRAHPRQVRVVEVEGSALATRLVGNLLYFAANKVIYPVMFEEATPEILLPSSRDTAVAPDVGVLPVDELRYFPDAPEASYLLLGAFDITKDIPCEVQSLLGAGQTFYMNQRSLYIVRPIWSEAGSVSDIYRFSLEGTDIRYEGTGRVEGQPLNQYSMDEYDGHFRIATTAVGSGNYITILDGALREVGRTPALAPDETIHSVRFMGSMGYVVTFRQMDPLFVVDLGDPAAPRVLGALKIPGFSEYLHPIGDGLMVGLGRHTRETFVRMDDGTEEVVGVQDAGVKLSLFDVSVPSDPRELDVLLLGSGSSEAEYNPRALMADAARRQIGIPLQLWDNEENFEGAVVVAVEDGRLDVRARLPEESSDNWYGYGRRLCYIGGTLYLVGGGYRIQAYDYDTFVPKGQLDLPFTPEEEVKAGIAPLID